LFFWKREGGGRLIWIAYLGVIAIALVMLSVSWFTVDAGERGVLLTWGKASMDPVLPGLHIKIPGVQTAQIFDVRTMKYEADASAASRDLQTVRAKIAVNYHLDPQAVPQIYVELGPAYAERVIQPTVQEVIKASTAKFSAEQLITNRTQVKDIIQQALVDRLSPYNIMVESIAITDFEFSQSFNEAIEAKVMATQQKQKADLDLQRVEVEARMKVEQAKAEAEALQLQKMVVTPELVELRKIEMQAKAIDRWDGHLPQVTGGAMPFLDLGGSVRTSS